MLETGQGQDARLRVGSLFSGLGAFDLGFQRAGFEIRWQVENDPACQSVLRRHFPHSEKFWDITTVGAHNLAPVDVIVGGFPCQDVSVAGQRRGLGGERSGLFWELLRIVDELQPSFLLWENVPGLLATCSCRACGTPRCRQCGRSIDTILDDGDDGAIACPFCGSADLRGGVLPEHRGADFFAIVSALGFVGLDGAWTLFDAQWFGVPQRRQRLFGVFAQRHLGAECAADILSFAHRSQGDTPPRRKAGSGLASEIAASLRGSGEGRRGFQLDAEAGLAGHGQPQIAAEASGGDDTSRGVNAPGRRQEDDVNIVVSTLQGGGKRGHRLDAESAAGGQLVVHPPVTPILEVTGRQGRSADSGLGIGKPGDPMVTLQAGKQHAVAYPDESENFVCVTGERTHALTSEGADASEDGGGRGTPIVTGPMVFETRVARNGRGAPTDVCPPLKAESGQSGKGDGAPMVFDTAQITSTVNRTRVEPGLPSSTPPSNSQMHLAGPAYGVRRLMPVECEKLQGLPPGWTAYGDDGTPLSDAARYRMVGNAGVVDVLVWIARRMKGAMEGALPMP